jgi:hypothetical protein
MKYLLNWLSIFVGALLLGCAAGPSVFVPVASSAENAAVVYIYRPAKTANMMLSPAVSVADNKSFEMKNGQYKRLTLSPGKYTVRLAATAGNSPALEHDLEVAEAQIYYLRVEASLKLGPGEGYQPYRRKFELLSVPAEKAHVEIAACTDMDGRDQQKSVATEVDDKARGAGDEAVFSVDKTANPFSR